MLRFLHLPLFLLAFAWAGTALAQKPELFVQTGHTSMISQVALSPDGTRLVSISYDAALVWDVTNDLIAKRLEIPAGVVFTSAAFSPDGTLFAASDGARVHVWSVDTWEEAHTFEGRSRSASLRYIPYMAWSGSTALVTAWDDGRIEVADPRTGSVARTFSVEGKVTQVAADTKVIAVALDSGAIHILDAGSGTTLRTVQRTLTDNYHSTYINNIVLNRQGTLLATNGTGEPRIQVFDVATGRQVFTHKQQTMGLAFNAEGTAVGGGFNVVDSSILIQFWDIAGGNTVASYTGAFDVMSSISLDANGALLAGGSVNQRLTLWDARSGRQVRSLGAQTPAPTDIVYNRDGSYIATIAPDDLVRVWEASTGRQLTTVRVGNPKVQPLGRSRIALSDDGALLAVAGDTMRVWNVSDGSLRQTYLRWETRRMDEGKPASAANRVLMNGDGSMAVTISPFEVITAWDAGTGVSLWRCAEVREDIVDAALNAEGTVLAAVDEKGDVWLIDARTGKLLHHMEHPDASSRRNRFAIGFQRDGKTVVTCDNTGLLARWSIRGAGIIDSTKLPYDDGRDLLLSGDASRLFVMARNRRQTIYDMATLKPVVESRSGYLNNLPALDETGRLFVAPDGVEAFSFVRLDAPRDTLRFSHSWGPTDAVADASSHYAAEARIAAGGTLVVGMYRDGLVVWNARTGKVVDRVYIQYTPARSVPGTLFVSRDGMRVIVGYGSQNAVVWDRARHVVTELKSVQQAAEQRTGRPLNALGVRFLPGGHRMACVSYDSAWVLNGDDGSFMESSPLPTAATRGMMMGGQNHMAFHSRDTVSVFSISPWALRGRFPLSDDTHRFFWSSLDSNGTSFAVARSDGQTVDLFDVASGAKVRSISNGDVLLQSVQLAPAGDVVAITSFDGRLGLWDTRSGRQLTSFPFGSGMSSVSTIAPDGRHMMTAGADAWMRLWDLRERRGMVSLLGIGTGDYIVATPDNYYTASKGAASAVAFRMAGTVFPFDQFDLRLNRPDQVLHAIGSADTKLIEAYYNAYLKRLKKLGLDEKALAEDATLPELAIATPNIPTITKSPTLRFMVRANDAEAKLERLLISVNGVAVFGSGGIDLRSDAQRKMEREIELPLAPGVNRVKVSVLNARGAESIRQFFTTTYDAAPAKPDLYLVAVGVSRFRTAQYNLSFAAKDAGDLCEYFEKKRDRFDSIHVLRILDEHATRDAILDARKLLGRSKPNDQVIVFVATHGLVDDSLEYYLATTDVDFEKPQTRGLRYDELETLLDGISARKKLLLVDACHSGELDRDDTKLIGSKDSTGSGWVKRRSFPRSKRVKTSLGLQNSFALVQELFTDLRRSSGATVIAAAAGEEFAYEDADWKNGAFTYALLDGLMTMAADRDRNGTVLVSELREYVTKVVSELTAGKQTPTSRRENITNDFPVLP